MNEKFPLPDLKNRIVHKCLLELTSFSLYPSTEDVERPLIETLGIGTN